MEETKLTKELGIAIAVVWKQWSCPFSDEPGVKGGPRAAANVREGGGGKGREGGRAAGCAAADATSGAAPSETAGVTGRVAR